MVIVTKLCCESHPVLWAHIIASIDTFNNGCNNLISPTLRTQWFNSGLLRVDIMKAVRSKSRNIGMSKAQICISIAQPPLTHLTMAVTILYLPPSEHNGSTVVHYGSILCRQASIRLGAQACLELTYGQVEHSLN